MILGVASLVYLEGEILDCVMEHSTKAFPLNTSYFTQKVRNIEKPYLLGFLQSKETSLYTSCYVHVINQRFLGCTIEYQTEMFWNHILEPGYSRTQTFRNLDISEPGYYGTRNTAIP